MPRFDATFKTTLELPHSPERVAAHFADLATIAAHSADVERWEADGDALHFVLTEQDHKITKFKGEYTARYRLRDGVLTWETDTSRTHNMGSSGRAVFVAAGTGTRLEYTESLFLDLDVPALMAKPLKPMIAAILKKEVGEYVRDMAASVA